MSDCCSACTECCLTGGPCCPQNSSSPGLVWGSSLDPVSHPGKSEAALFLSIADAFSCCSDMDPAEPRRRLLSLPEGEKEEEAAKAASEALRRISEALQKGEEVPLSLLDVRGGGVGTRSSSSSDRLFSIFSSSTLSITLMGFWAR